MKFRTEIDIKPFKNGIDHSKRIFAIGSCFAESISARLAQAKFHVHTNPTGVLFNPLSIAKTIRCLTNEVFVEQSDMQQMGDLYFHYDFHGSFSDCVCADAVKKMNDAVRMGAEALRKADTVIITLGTAWIYERGGEVVANCHKQPASEFVRRRLGCEEIANVICELALNELKGKNIILTISPVRHVGDTLEGNFLSKATLKLAVAELSDKLEQVDYFPSYEILIDDLRDYRYYADDMVHPSSQAIEYIWEKFSMAVLDERTQKILPQIAKVVAATNHRPMNADNKAYRDFCLQQMANIKLLPQVDFSSEERYFSDVLGINL